MEFSLVGSTLPNPRVSKLDRLLSHPRSQANTYRSMYNNEHQNEIHNGYHNGDIALSAQRWQVQNEQQLVVQMYTHVKAQKKTDGQDTKKPRVSENKLLGFKKSYRTSNKAPSQALTGKFNTIPPIACGYVPKSLRLAGLPAVTSDPATYNGFPDGMLVNIAGPSQHASEQTAKVNNVNHNKKNTVSNNEPNDDSHFSAKPGGGALNQSQEAQTVKNKDSTKTPPSSQELKLSLKTLPPPVATPRGGHATFRSDTTPVATDYTFDWVASRHSNYGFHTMRGPGQSQIKFNSRLAQRSKRQKFAWDHSKDALGVGRQLTTVKIDGTNL